jgi:hypothetical protein
MSKQSEPQKPENGKVIAGPFTLPVSDDTQPHTWTFPPNYYPPKYDCENDKHFDIDDTELFLGERRSGKSTQCMEWNLKRRRLYPYVWCFSKTAINNYWHQVLPEAKICGPVTDDVLEALVRNILETNSQRYAIWKANKQATGHIAGNPIVKIIFEDYVSAQTLRKLDVLQEICFNGRHHGIATDILSQDYVGMTPGERDNMDRFILYRPDSGRTRNMIRESFGNEILEIAERVWNNGKALVVCKKKRVPPLERLAWTEGDVAYNKAAIHKNLVLGCNRMWEDVDIKKQKKKRPYVELPSLSTLEAQFNVPIERVEPESDDSEAEDKDLDEALADIDLPKDAKDTAKDIEEAGGKKRPSISSNETPAKRVRFA